MWQLGFTNSFLLYIFSLFLGQQQPMQQQQQQPMQQQQQPMQQQQQQPMQQGVKGREVIWAGELCWHENSNPGTTKVLKRTLRKSSSSSSKYLKV